MKFKVVFSKDSHKDLASIKDQRTLNQILERVGLLEENPEFGKPLRGELKLYRSLRAAGNRYRIVYRIKYEKVIVLVIAIGTRKSDDHDDVYRSLERVIGKKRK